MRITAAPCSSRYWIVGRLARRRVSSATAPSSSGTLKSTRTSTRLPVTSISRTVFLSIDSITMRIGLAYSPLPASSLARSATRTSAPSAPSSATPCRDVAGRAYGARVLGTYRGSIPPAAPGACGRNRRLLQRISARPVPLPAGFQYCGGTRRPAHGCNSSPGAAFGGLTTSLGGARMNLHCL